MNCIQHLYTNLFSSIYCSGEHIASLCKRVSQLFYSLWEESWISTWFEARHEFCVTRSIPSAERYRVDDRAPLSVDFDDLLMCDARIQAEDIDEVSEELIAAPAEAIHDIDAIYCDDSERLSPFVPLLSPEAYIQQRLKTYKERWQEYPSACAFCDRLLELMTQKTSSKRDWKVLYRDIKDFYIALCARVKQEACVNGYIFRREMHFLQLFCVESLACKSSYPDRLILCRELQAEMLAWPFPYTNLDCGTMQRQREEDKQEWIYLKERLLAVCQYTYDAFPKEVEEIAKGADGSSGFRDAIMVNRPYNQEGRIIPVKAVCHHEDDEPFFEPIGTAHSYVSRQFYTVYTAAEECMPEVVAFLWQRKPSLIDILVFVRTMNYFLHYHPDQRQELERLVSLAHVNRVLHTKWTWDGLAPQICFAETS